MDELSKDLKVESLRTGEFKNLCVPILLVTYLFPEVVKQNDKNAKPRLPSSKIFHQVDEVLLVA